MAAWEFHRHSRLTGPFCPCGVLEQFFQNSNARPPLAHFNVYTYPLIQLGGLQFVAKSFDCIRCGGTVQWTTVHQ